MSHQKLLNSLINKNKQENVSGKFPVDNKNVSKQNVNNKEKSNKNQPSLKELMKMLNMFDPNNLKDIDIDAPECKDNPEQLLKLDKMYVKTLDENPNKYLLCKLTGMYLPTGYRYAGYHLSSSNKKTALYTRQNEDGYYVVHCLGKKVDKHNNYDVYEPIDITSKLPNTMMQMVKDGIEISV